jgi:hypothetical protein
VSSGISISILRQIMWLQTVLTWTYEATWSPFVPVLFRSAYGYYLSTPLYPRPYRSGYRCDSSTFITIQVSGHCGGCSLAAVRMVGDIV